MLSENGAHGMANLGRGPVGVDTTVFIYFIEEHPQFLPLLEPLFREVDKGRRELGRSSHTESRGPGRRDFARSSARRRTTKSRDGSQDTRLSSACGRMGGWLRHFPHE